MSTEKPTQDPRDRDIVKPLDSHQPILGADLTPQVPSRGERDVIKPNDSHQPIAGNGINATVDDSHQPGPGQGVARKNSARPTAGEGILPMDSHQPIGKPN